LGVANKTFIASNEQFLELVDGGEDGEVMPIQPLLVKAREVDVVLLLDAVSCRVFFFLHLIICLI
jgi:lysophospholipase